MKKLSIRQLAANAIVAALYVALTVINPISAGMFQFRVSTLLVPVGFINPKLAWGVILGVVISNFWSPFGVVDILGGAIIQLVTFFVFRRKFESPYVCSVLYGIWCGIVVAGVLHIVAGAPYWLSVFSVAVSNIALALIGSYICDKYLRKHLMKI